MGCSKRARRGERGAPWPLRPTLCYTHDVPMTRKFVYDPRVERTRMVAGGTPAHATGSYEAPRRAAPLRWLWVALVLTASALAFDAAHAVAQAREHASLRR